MATKFAVNGAYFCANCEEWKPVDQFPKKNKSYCKSCMSKYYKDWRSKNYDKVVENRHNYDKTWMGRFVRIVDQHKQRTGKPLDPERDTLTFEDLQKLFELQDGKCADCGKKLEGWEWEFDHCIPVCKNGPLSFDNGQILCSDCNKKKGRKVIKFRDLPKMQITQLNINLLLTFNTK